MQKGNTKLAISVNDPNFVKHSKTVDLVGQRFTRLTVLSLAGYTLKRHAAWLCRCDCGIEKIISQSSLRGKVKSCGCLIKEIGTQKVTKINALLPVGGNPLKTLYKSYKELAEKRGYNFELSTEEFNNIIKQNCAYCSIPPFQKRNNLLFNGVDRVDNTKGYTSDNVVPCCGRCNTAKMDYTVEEFKEWVKNLYETLWKENYAMITV